MAGSFAFVSPVEAGVPSAPAWVEEAAAAAEVTACLAECSTVPHLWIAARVRWFKATVAVVPGGTPAAESQSMRADRRVVRPLRPSKSGGGVIGRSGVLGDGGGFMDPGGGRRIGWIGCMAGAAPTVEAVVRTIYHVT